MKQKGAIHTLEVLWNLRIATSKEMGKYRLVEVWAHHVVEEPRKYRYSDIQK